MGNIVLETNGFIKAFVHFYPNCWNKQKNPQLTFIPFKYKIVLTYNRSREGAPGSAAAADIRTLYEMKHISERKRLCVRTDNRTASYAR